MCKLYFVSQGEPSACDLVCNLEQVCKSFLYVWLLGDRDPEVHDINLFSLIGLIGLHHLSLPNYDQVVHAATEQHGTYRDSHRTCTQL